MSIPVNVDNVPEGGEAQDSNNRLKPSSNFQSLDATEKENLLRKLGCLFGVRIDGNDGPRISTRPVAKCKIEGQHHFPAWISERSDVITEVIQTDNNRDANFIHDGWSQIAADTVPTWTASRIAKNNRATLSGQWTTRRMTFQRLALDIPLPDLVPVSEFEQAVQDALNEQTMPGKHQALDRVFQFWSVFDSGLSLTATDIGSKTPELPNPNPSLQIQDLLSHGTARIGIRAGEAVVGQGDIIASLTNASKPCEWVQTRIVRVVPVTELLSHDLKTQVTNLHSALLSYFPLDFNGIGEHGGSFDGTDHAMKIITSIAVQCAGHIYSLTVNYLDGSRSEQYGGTSDRQHIFKIRKEEFVTEIVVWNDPGQEAISGVQFITNLGRVSPHYGGHGGTPAVLSSKDGCLVAFCGRLVNHSQVKVNMISQVQAVWRRNVMETCDFQYSVFLGGSGGIPFNDRAYIGSSGSGFIRSIRIKCSSDKTGLYIDSIQAEYGDNSSGKVTYSMGPCHGGLQGEETLFQLEPGEYITAVIGNNSSYVYQLGFVTNNGRVSPLCGGERGQNFRCQAPLLKDGKIMGLSYIMGKRLVDLDYAQEVWHLRIAFSEKWLNGLLLVWAPL
ncbi:hypothetical protein FRC08_013058 [Ceratobasidium sp. 394]|nr:hypothetical protein FRC08_013058 [Ceratobasidium sp. 394]